MFLYNVMLILCVIKLYYQNTPAEFIPFFLQILYFTSQKPHNNQCWYFIGETCPRGKVVYTCNYHPLFKLLPARIGSLFLRVSMWWAIRIAQPVSQFYYEQWELMHVMAHKYFLKNFKSHEFEWKKSYWKRCFDTRLRLRDHVPCLRNISRTQTSPFVSAVIPFARTASFFFVLIGWHWPLTSLPLFPLSTFDP